MESDVDPHPVNGAKAEQAAAAHKRFESRIELFAAIVLAIATVAATWSAFQATKWRSSANDS